MELAIVPGRRGPLTVSSAINQLSPQFISGAIPNGGLTFTADSASDGGRPVSLSAIVNDTSGRFTDTQRRYAKRIQEQQTADALSEAVHQRGSRHKGFS